jgi:hypothetical protein
MRAVAPLRGTASTNRKGIDDTLAVPVLQLSIHTRCKDNVVPPEGCWFESSPRSHTQVGPSRADS